MEGDQEILGIREKSNDEDSELEKWRWEGMQIPRASQMSLSGSLYGGLLGLEGSDSDMQGLNLNQNETYAVQ